MELQFSHLEDLNTISQQIINFAGDSKIWLFEGQMAAGKTTLIKEICTQIGVNGNIGSPTYSLVNEYITDSNKTIYHFDFYRLKSEMEALDYGLEEYFDSGHLCLCEWPSMIPNLWPNEFLMLNLDVLEDGSRQIILEKHSH
jgi:tRNA threonylcarbamoyladenosine biosynthesis protein TsaE